MLNANKNKINTNKKRILKILTNEKNMKNILITMAIILILSPCFLISQQSIFYFDVFVTKSEYNDSAKVDIFCCIPNKILTFNKEGNNYISKYNVSFNFSDSSSNKTKSFSKKNSVNVNDFMESQGINADFSLLSHSINLASGNYKLRVMLKDEISGNEYLSSRNISVINYNSFDFSISTILLLSNIEEYNDTYIITPYLSDNVYSLDEGYFVFFELYNNTEERKINITTEIRNIDNKVIYNTGVSKNIDTGTTQYYVKIPSELKYGIENNHIKIFVTDGISGTITADSAVKILAAASRNIRYISTINDKIIKNLSNSIRQLKYVATSRQIDTILRADTDADKLRLFEEFWKKLDPTPHTEKNEAMEEYYRRIEYADLNFKVYGEGWLTDKGHVYIVFGAPLSIDRTNNSFADNRTFERWNYEGRVIVFLDVSGFGDFRLYSPSVISDKYEWRY